MSLKNWKNVSLALLLAIPLPLWAQNESPGAAKAAAKPADTTAVLKAIPSDASAFLTIPSLQKMDEDVQGVANQLQLAGLIPPPLDLLKSYVGIQEGLNESAGVAFVVLNLSQVKNTEAVADHFVLLIPASDANALIKALGGTEKDGDYTKITLMGQPSLAMAKEGYVVAAEKAGALKAYSAAKLGIDKGLAPDRLKEISNSDLFVWANPSSVSKELRGAIQEALTALMGKMSPIATSAPGGQMDQINQVIDQLEEFTASLSLDGKKGLVVNWYVKAKADSDMAKQMASMKPVEGSLLAGLPDEQIIFAAGAAGTAGDAATTKQLNNSLSQVFQVWTDLAKTAGVELDASKVDPIKDSVVAILSGVQRVALSMSVLTVEGGEGRLGFALTGKVKNSQEWVGHVHKLFDQLKQVIVDAAKKEGAAEDRVKQVADNIQWKAGAETVDSAKVDHFVVNIEKMPDAETHGEDIEKIKGFIGKEGVLIRVAAVGPDQVLITFGGGAKRFTDLLAVAKSGKSPLSENKEVKKVANRLPKGDRIIEAYLSIENILSLVSSTAAQFGQPLPMPLALRNAAPIVFTSTKIGNGQQSEVLVPMELMVSVKETVIPLMMMMGGGMGGEAPPGAAPAPEPGGELK